MIVTSVDQQQHALRCGRGIYVIVTVKHVVFSLVDKISFQSFHNTNLETNKKCLKNTMIHEFYAERNACFLVAKKIERRRLGGAKPEACKS
jgi:hypothetical protein